MGTITPNEKQKADLIISLFNELPRELKEKVIKQLLGDSRENLGGELEIKL